MSGRRNIPEVWHQDIIFPVHKGKGSQSNCRNHRGVTSAVSAKIRHITILFNYNVKTENDLSDFYLMLTLCSKCYLCSFLTFSFIHNDPDLVKHFVSGFDRTDRIEVRNDESSSRGSMARRGRGGQGRGAVTDGGFNRFGKREFERHSGSDRT